MKGLREHLQKSEIEFIASRGGGYPETFKWEKDIQAQLKRLGFRFQEGFFVEGSEVVMTTSNISIGLQDGFIYKTIKKGPWKNV